MKYKIGSEFSFFLEIQKISIFVFCSWATSVYTAPAALAATRTGRAGHGPVRARLLDPPKTNPAEGVSVVLGVAHHFGSARAITRIRPPTGGPPLAAPSSSSCLNRARRRVCVEQSVVNYSAGPKRNKYARGVNCSKCNDSPSLVVWMQDKG